MYPYPWRGKVPNMDPNWWTPRFRWVLATRAYRVLSDVSDANVSQLELKVVWETQFFFFRIEKPKVQPKNIDEMAGWETYDLMFFFFIKHDQ